MNRLPKILVVDDRPENLLAIRTVLRDLDVELIEATSGNEALKATLYHDFSLALLDIQMPEMDGYELATILREEEKTARLPFIFISAVYTDNMNVFKGYERGAFSFITKPFQPEILINKVKFFMEIHRQEMAINQLNNDLQDKNLALLASNKELESFTYSVSHDLRAPLRAMSGYAQILLEEHTSGLNENGKRMLQRISVNSGKMSGLIDNLLEFSRVGRTELVKQLIDMDQLVKEILDDTEIYELSKKAKLVVQPLPQVRGDALLLKQVWVNLLTNAAKYSGKIDEPVIEVGAQTKDGENIYYVKDNGAGFDMKYQDKLFGVFQRLHTNDEFEGTGIGLAIVQRIVVRSGGHVWAEGEIDKGATFYFALPAA